MNDLDSITLVGVYLSEGEIKRRDWVYCITQRQGNHLYTFKLGDASKDLFGEQCELIITESNKSAITYKFNKTNGQWILSEWTPLNLKILNLPDNQFVSEALGDAFDNIFARYYQEILQSVVPDNISRKPSKKQTDHENDTLFDLLDEDLLRPIIIKAGQDGVLEHDLHNIELKAAAAQIKRLREVDTFLLKQMTEKDLMIDKLKDSFQLDKDAWKEIQSNDQKSNDKQKSNEVFIKNEDVLPIHIDLLTEKVWDELILRLAFPTIEKETEIHHYFSQSVKTWLPLIFETIQGNITSNNVQGMNVNKKNFFNDLQDANIYPGEPEALKDLCSVNSKLTNIVLDYFAKYGKKIIKAWWIEYQTSESSSDINF